MSPAEAAHGNWEEQGRSWLLPLGTQDMAAPPGLADRILDRVDAAMTIRDFLEFATGALVLGYLRAACQLVGSDLAGQVRRGE